MSYTKDFSDTFANICIFPLIDFEVTSMVVFPLATKHGKVVTHREGIPPINLFNPLNMCPREIT